MGARVGRSITLSSSQTHNHNITRGSLNQWDPSMAHTDGKAVMGPNRDFGQASAGIAGKAMR